MVRAENPELVETESSRKLVLEARSTTTAQLEQVKKLGGADPEEIQDTLASTEDDSDDVLVDLHHQVLKKTQGVVRAHLHFIAGLQALSTALREREHIRFRAQESVIEMFTVKCLCTIYAMQMAQFASQLLSLLIITIFSSLGEESNKDLALFVERCVYATLVLSLVPPLQFFMAKRDKFGIYTRLHCAISLFTKGLPMILAWAMKDVVESFLKLTDWLFWDDLLVTAVLVLAVTGLQHLPAVVRAKADLKSKPPKDSVCNRYCNLPDNTLLACGFGINRVSRFLVEQTSELAISHLPTGAQTMLNVVFQILYFSLMSVAVIRLDAWFSSTRAQRQQYVDEAARKHDSILEMELEVANGLGDTMTHALAFVYGWGVSDTLRSIYYVFFLGCTSWRTCDYPKVWYFAILSTLVLGYGMQKLSLQEFRSVTSKSYRSLMTTAMSLTLGWAWMNVCVSTTSFFLKEFGQYDSGPWVAPIVYLLLLFFVYVFMVEVYWQVLDDLRVSRRERKEFYEAYPLIPDESAAATPTSYKRKDEETPGRQGSTASKREADLVAL